MEMNSLFTRVEEALIAKIEGHFKEHLKAVKGVSGAINAESFKHQSLATPGVFIRFIGFQKGQTEGEVRTRWALFPLISQNMGAEKSRHGTDKKMGMHDLLHHLIALIDEQDIGGIATASLVNGNELYSTAMDKQGFSIWALELEAVVHVDSVMDLSSLGKFQTFNSTLKNKDAVMAQDQLKLEQDDDEESNS